MISFVLVSANRLTDSLFSGSGRYSPAAVPCYNLHRYWDISRVSICKARIIVQTIQKNIRKFSVTPYQNLLRKKINLDLNIRPDTRPTESHGERVAFWKMIAHLKVIADFSKKSTFECFNNSQKNLLASEAMLLNELVSKEGWWMFLRGSKQSTTCKLQGSKKNS